MGVPVQIVELTTDDPEVAHETVNGRYGGSGRARGYGPQDRAN